eukprot:867788-Pelagomonas_calceolata.AAC.1
MNVRYIQSCHGGFCLQSAAASLVKLSRAFLRSQGLRNWMLDPPGAGPLAVPARHLLQNQPGRVDFRRKGYIAVPACRGSLAEAEPASNQTTGSPI